METLKGERALFKGLENGFWKIITNWARIPPAGEHSQFSR